MSLDQLAGEGFTVVFRGVFSQFLQSDVEFAKRQSNLLGFLLGVGELLAHEVGLHRQTIDVGLGFSALGFMINNECFSCTQGFAEVLVLLTGRGQCCSHLLLFGLSLLKLLQCFGEGRVGGDQVGLER